MAFETISPNMSLPIPGVGLTEGPQYASDLNICLNLIDSHNHSPGFGVQITPDGLNINSDLSILSNNLTNARSLRLVSQSGVLTGPSDSNCVYVNGGNLYYNNNNSVPVQLTNGTSIVGASGNIAGLVAPAAATYNGGPVFTYVWQSDSGGPTPANMDFAAATFRNLTAGSFGLTVQPPTLLANATLTLPTPPASNAPLIINSSGNITPDPLLYTAFSPVGSITMYGGTSAPPGWFICDGSPVSRTTYSALFAVVGESFGEGDNLTTFNIPDLRGRFVRGLDAGAGRDPDAATRTAMNTGGNMGDNIGSVQNDAFESHTHTQNAHSHGITPSGGTVGTAGAVVPGGVTVSVAANPAALSINNATPTNNNTGGNETRPINAYLNFIIKY